MVVELNFHVHASLDLPVNPNGFLPDWQGHTVTLAASFASIFAINMITSLVFGRKEMAQQSSEPSCYNLFGYEIFCWQKTCYETSCSYWDSLWNNCIPRKVCYSF